LHGHPCFTGKKGLVYCHLCIHSPLPAFQG
jgi:hypothetical protein